MDEDIARWQSVMIITNKRIECLCGALAIFITGKSPDNDEYSILDESDAWCQECYFKAVEEQEKETR